MGRFFYDEGVRLDVDDRVLAHLQVVIANKLRRGEPFHFTWRDDVSTGGGRTTVWVHPRSNLVFTYAGGRLPQLNRAWLDALMMAANSLAGLSVVPETPEDADSDPVI
jgi:hypothetical protein